MVRGTLDMLGTKIAHKIYFHFSRLWMQQHVRCSRNSANRGGNGDDGYVGNLMYTSFELKLNRVNKNMMKEIAHTQRESGMLWLFLLVRLVRLHLVFERKNSWFADILCDCVCDFDKYSKWKEMGNRFIVIHTLFIYSCEEKFGTVFCGRRL